MITFSNMTHGEFISANVAEAVTPLEKELFERLEQALDELDLAHDDWVQDDE